MKVITRLLCDIACVLLMLLTACDVREWPELPKLVPLSLRINYETDMTEWEYLYTNSELIEQENGKICDNHLSDGKIRYIVRAYPMLENVRTTLDYIQEFTFTKDVATGYNHEFTIELPSGNYNIMIWSDFVHTDRENSFYDVTNFAGIKLQGTHVGNSDYRDAFRGSGSIALVADVMEHSTHTLDITMQRPLAKFEFITTDVLDFIDKEYARIASKSNSADATSEDKTSTKSMNIEDYKVVFYYVGFMPDTYSIYSDKPVDSSTGVMFESSLKKLTGSEASMGFDYVFVNGKKSAVTIRIGIYDKDGVQLSMSNPVNVPLQRNRHTLLRGKFLMKNISGGIGIDPSYSGDYNIIL